jgi:cytochrome c oxidase assembly protein subunit 15
MAGTNHQRSIGIWLLICCAAVFGMVMLGGVTRLTGSGLSMVQWEPLLGVLPPLTQADWEEVFRLYQQYPEFKLTNYDMDLEAFKPIFWFEYTHRLLGRLIGIIFLLPLIYFIVRKRIDRPLVPKLVTMFILGGLQGLLGWYMVKSGLVHAPHVSQYRLTAHLGLAFLIYAYMFWVALDLLFPRADGYANRVSPGGMSTLEPQWKNLFENVTTVQFDHRLLATLLFLIIPVYWFAATRVELPSRVRSGFYILVLMLIIQLALGISTLLLHVPVALAAGHQGGAMVLFTIALFLTHQLMNSKYNAL